MTNMNPSDFFNQVEEGQAQSVPAMQSHVKKAKQQPAAAKPKRDIADHHKCFYPDCTDDRVKSSLAKSPDGKILTCNAHRSPEFYPFASYAHNRWRNGFPAPVHGARRVKVL